ncbi:MAG: hypothetical protein TREMPRED_000042 [Tremellales sp. Tagirdzhanova-0007]|nr:MAG: hypothetical protein TREMPRED_000042 [Tremellales sp. Tagirdzhanova-0007]
MSPFRERPHLAMLSMIPSTPPPSYPSAVTSPTSYYSPSTPSPRREVIMGGLVSPGPVINGEHHDEKRGMSIDVPGIILTGKVEVDGRAVAER